MNQHTQSPAPHWASRWLWAAGVYNLLWGAAIIAFPHLIFDLTGLPRMQYPEIWQCVGMIVGVYGIGYLIAAEDPRRHWPIILVGLLGKIFGPIGFIEALSRGVFPPVFGITLLTNDLMWWIPFGLILRDAYKHRRTDRQTFSASCMTYVKESVINASAKDVFAFHESPATLEQLIPPWENVRVTESAGSLKPGSRVVLQGRAGPIPLRWVALHTEYDPPHHFADRQVSGPFAYWHHQHIFIEDDQGNTLLRDEITFQPPLGLTGAYLGGWLIRRKLDRMFKYRHETTKRLVESGAWKNPDTQA